MRRFIYFTPSAELKRQEEDKHRYKTAHPEYREIDGSEREIRAYIEKMREEGHQVHQVMLKEHCQHCGGCGFRRVRDVKFDTPKETPTQ